MNTSFEQRLRIQLHEVASTIVSDPRQFDHSRHIRRRRRIVAIGAAGLVLFGGGIAIAARLIPNDVKRVNKTLTELGSCGTIVTSRSEMVAFAPRPDGSRLELWVSPTSTHNIATNLRIVRPDGSAGGDTAVCGYEDPKRFEGTGASTDPDGQSQGMLDIYGRTDPGASAVRVTFYSGKVVTVDVQTDGYFVLSLVVDVTKYEQVKLIEPIS